MCSTLAEDLVNAEPTEAGDAYLPGYTHLQRAQPVLLAHHLLAHGWALARDVDRLFGDVVARSTSRHSARARSAGSSSPLDPDLVAEELGIHQPFRELPRRGVRPRLRRRGAVRPCACWRPSLAHRRRGRGLTRARSSVSIRLDDAWATGSSMLPQKKNPDIAELARGKAGRLIGHLAGFLTTLKGLPLAYNRDLQEDKEPLFDALDQVVLALDALAGLDRIAAVRHRPDADRCRRARPRAPSTWPSGSLERDGVSGRSWPGRRARARSLDAGVPLGELVAARPRLR